MLYPASKYSEGAVSEPLRRTSHLDVRMIVASAAIATAGPFLDVPLAEESQLIALKAAQQGTRPRPSARPSHATVLTRITRHGTPDCEGAAERTRCRIYRPRPSMGPLG